jgi:hypothetical protein
MINRLGFCCDHVWVEARAIKIAARREMRLMNRAIDGSPGYMKCRVLLYFITLSDQDCCWNTSLPGKRSKKQTP